MTKHTPVPWKVSGKFIISEPNLAIAELSVVPEIVANARLIASAPELLEACKDLIGQVEQAQKGFIRYIGSPTMDFAIKQTEQAIAKAEGEVKTRGKN